MPGLENLKDYTFKFGKSPLIELPLAVNPTGCARTEPHLRTFVRRFAFPFNLFTVDDYDHEIRSLFLEGYL